MKIAFDCQIFTQQSYGGVSRYFTHLAHELAKQEKVRIFANIHCNKYIDELPKTISNGINITKYSNKFPKFLFSLSNQLNNTSMRLWHPDIIHETYYRTAISGSRNCLRVITVFDMIHELFPGYFTDSDRVIKTKKIAIERADKIICISHSTKQDLIKILGVDEHKIYVTHLGYGEFIHTHNPLEIPQRPYLLYVGNRNGYKNFSGFINAFALSNTLKKDFNIIAFGGGGFNKTEIELLRNIGLDSKNVIQINGSDEQLSTIYRHAKAFIYPSIYEGFGLPPLEAMAHKCPVISSDSSSMPEVIGDAGVYFSPTDQDDIKNTIEKTVYDDSILQNLIDKGLKRIQLFTWQKCANETLKIYQGVV